MSHGVPPTLPPTAAELLQDPLVQLTLDQAWADSLPNDAAQRHEEGGWIYMDTTTGDISSRRAPRGEASHIDLTNPPIKRGAVVVGKFHTHPNLESEGWNPGPSRDDVIVDETHGVPDIIRAEDGVHFSGPQSRRGGLAGHQGFPI